MSRGLSGQSAMRDLTGGNVDLGGGGSGAGDWADHNATNLTTTQAVRFGAYGSEPTGLGDTSNPLFHANGDGVFNGVLRVATLVADTIETTSDERVKISVQKQSSNIVRDLQPVSYVLTDKEGNVKRGGRRTVGFMAQALEKLDSTVVSKNNVGDYSVDYRALGVHCIQAVQVLQKQLEDLQKKVV